MEFNTIVAVKSAEALITYTCSKCNTHNQFAYEIVGEKKIFSMADRYGERERLLCERARAIAERKMYNKIDAFEEQMNNGEYAELLFEHRCTHCGHIEPWAVGGVVQDSKYAPAVEALAKALVIVGAPAVFVKPAYGGILIVTGALVGLTLDTWLKARRRKRIKKACAALPEGALPKA